MNDEQIELAKAVMDHIEADPDHHDQTTWLRATPCGTAGCFAGWTVLLSGCTFAPQVDLDRVERESLQVWKIDSEGRLHDWMYGTGLYPADTKTVGEWAQEHLGLNDENARALFHTKNTREHLRAMVDMLAEDPQVDLYAQFDHISPDDYY